VQILRKFLVWKVSVLKVPVLKDSSSDSSVFWIFSVFFSVSEFPCFVFFVLFLYVPFLQILFVVMLKFHFWKFQFFENSNFSEVQFCQV